MMNFIHKLISKLLGRNLNSTPVDVIVDQMKEVRALPVGIAEFDEWSDRIISGCLLPADPVSMKFMLASSLLALPATMSHKEDAYFIHALRKAAVNQIAQAKMKEFQELRDAKAKDEAKSA